MHPSVRLMIGAAQEGADAFDVHRLLTSSALVAGGDDVDSPASPARCIQHLLNPVSPPTPSMQDCLERISEVRGPSVALNAAATFFSQLELSVAAPISLPAASNLCDFFSQELCHLQTADLHDNMSILIQLRDSLKRLGPPSYAAWLHQDLVALIDGFGNLNRVPKAPSLQLPHSDLPSPAVNFVSMGFDIDGEGAREELLAPEDEVPLERQYAADEVPLDDPTHSQARSPMQRDVQRRSLSPLHACRAHSVEAVVFRARGPYSTCVILQFHSHAILKE